MYTKIKINSKDDLPLNSPFLIFDVVMFMKSVFEDEGACYPQVFLEKYWYIT